MATYQRGGRPGQLDGATPAQETPSPDSATNASPGPTQRRKIVLPDPVAFRFLEEDPAVSVVERRDTLTGYELYLVEQWACSRQSPTLVIATYTGDERQSIVVGTLSVPADDGAWSPRLRLYFNAIQQYHARSKATALGELMVTNLNSFPSALTVIPVPDGDIRKHRLLFIVNEDLKRLGCSGRSALTLSEPSSATQAKFYELYKISDRVSFFQAVLELVKLCQVALFMFGKLEQEYIDGLLCDVTETAIGNWWTEIGAEHYNFEPTDGILGPTTVAALLGLLMGSRNRLNYTGVPVSKDVFDIDSIKRGIATFQRAQKLDKTRRLDRQTILKLYTLTAKAAAGEGWGVQKAVKSTVSEIGGKRGEMVMGMVGGGREKAGIGDIETLDINRFAQLAYGDRAKWLWHGKPRRTGTDQTDKDQDVGAMLFGKEDLLGPISRRTKSIPLEDEPEPRRRDEFAEPLRIDTAVSTPGVLESPNDRDGPRKKVLKSVADKMSDARSGLGRIKGVVQGGGRRGHVARPSISTKDDALEGQNGSSIFALAQQSTSLSSPVMAGKVMTWKSKSEDQPQGKGDIITSMAELLGPLETGENGRPAGGMRRQHKSEADAGLSSASGTPRDAALSPPPVAGSAIGGQELDAAVVEARLHRRHSAHTLGASGDAVDENKWPRRMSFGEAEEAVLRWEDIIDVAELADKDATSDLLVELTRSLYASMESIRAKIEPWVAEKLKSVEEVDDRLGKEHDDLQNLYQQLSEAYQRVRQSSTELVAEERAHMTENVKEVEVLVARLDYEINSLVSKVEDVEDGVLQFERHVEDVERRAADLKAQLETESFLHFVVRTLTGIGTGPNITRE